MNPEKATRHCRPALIEIAFNKHAFVEIAQRFTTIGSRILREVSVYSGRRRESDEASSPA
jgi:hypothetical protein